MTILVRRVAATQSVVDAWRGRPFAWGDADCGRLAAAMLSALGHKPRLSRFGFYKSEFGARRAMLKNGFRDMADVIDSFGFPRMGQARALPGDIVGFRHPDQPMDVAIGVTVGNGRVLAFMDNGDGAGERCHIFSPLMAAATADYLAWRVDPA